MKVYVVPMVVGVMICSSGWIVFVLKSILDHCIKVTYWDCCPYLGKGPKRFKAAGSDLTKRRIVLMAISRLEENETRHRRVTNPAIGQDRN